jgi:hypothetical protein
MASVEPTATYPKTYVVNHLEYTVHNAAEDASFQASPLYASNITVKSYPKKLVLGGVETVAHNSGEEVSIRSNHGQG